MVEQRVRPAKKRRRQVWIARNQSQWTSEAVHEEFRTEDGAVKSSGTMKKRRRGRHLAAGRPGEPKQLTRGICGSRRKLAAACRKMTHSAEVARRRGHDRRRYDQDDVVQETRKGRTLREPRGRGASAVGSRYQAT
jgi:hypothetical protein